MKKDVRENLSKEDEKSMEKNIYLKLKSENTGWRIKEWNKEDMDKDLDQRYFCVIRLKKDGSESVCYVAKDNVSYVEMVGLPVVSEKDEIPF